MTQQQFNDCFKIAVPNWEVMTLTDRRLHYNAIMENYYGMQQITQRQRNNWGHPKFLTSKQNKINCNAY